MKEVKRICIYPKDVQLITGKSERQARRILDEIRQELCKADHQFITIEEFCKYSGLPVDKVKPLLTD